MRCLAQTRRYWFTGSSCAPKGLTVALASILLLSASAWAQSAAVPAFASPEKAAAHKAAFERKVKAMHLLRSPDWYYRWRINVTKERTLYKEGIDLPALDMRAGSGTYRENLLYTDAVIKGTVISKKSDERKEVYYHSLYEIKVDEVLAGQTVPIVITVCLRTGKAGDLSLRMRDEPALNVGEQVLLYLNPVDFAELAAAKAEGSWNYENNAQPGSFNLVEKYLIKDAYVFEADNSRIDRTTTVSTNIRRITALLDKTHFYQQSFD